MFVSLHMSVLKERSASLERSIGKFRECSDFIGQSVRVGLQGFQSLFSHHDVKKRDTEVKIAAKLVDEEEQYRRRKQMYPHLWKEKQWEQGLVSQHGLSYSYGYF